MEQKEPQREDEITPVESESVPRPEESAPKVETTPQPAKIDMRNPIADVPRKPDSRVRKFFRSMVRWIILIVALFAAGVVTAYFLLYQPAREQINSLQGELATAQQEIETRSQELQSAQNEITALKAQKDAAVSNLDNAENRAYLQMVLTNVANARLALANKDGANARTALTAARADLEKLLPAVQVKDKDVAAGLLSRLDLALSELSRDPRTAIADLDVLTRSLQDAEKTLFP